MTRYDAVGERLKTRTWLTTRLDRRRTWLLTRFKSETTRPDASRSTTVTTRVAKLKTRTWLLTRFES